MAPARATLGAIARPLALAVLLFAIWLLLSGRWDGVALASGAAASLLVAALALRMDGAWGRPFAIGWRLLLYLPWLAWQTARANLAVAAIVLAPRLRLDAAAGWVTASQSSETGLTAFANSITLTPGTVSLAVEKGRIYVHALSRRGLEGLGEMDRRVRALETAAAETGR